jgi:hypothetical protein
MPVRPGDCRGFEVDRDPGEVGRVVQRFQHAGPVLGGEVDVTCGAVAEPQTQYVVTDDGDAGYDWQVGIAHADYSAAVVLWRAGARYAGFVPSWRTVRRGAAWPSP